MKKVFCLITFVMVCANVYISNINSKSLSSDDLFLSNLEVIANNESGKPYCYNGGPGSNACSIDGGIDIMGQGVSASCSVQCNPGYYACCGLRCTCVKE